MRKIGLAALTCIELAPPELVSVAADTGYDFVGLRLIPVATQTLPSFEMRELERRLADTGMKVLDVEVFRIDPDSNVRAYEPMLATAQRLGATDILVHGADPEEARLVENFGRLCDLAARHKLNANLEPMPWVDVSTVAKAARVVRLPNSAVLVDPIHFYRADNRIEDLKGLKYRYLQFCDARKERPTDPQELIRQARGDRLFPGEGGLDLRGLLRALPADLPISLEIPHAGGLAPGERARRAIEATKSLLAAL